VDPQGLPDIVVQLAQMEQAALAEQVVQLAQMEQAALVV
jgi:hypothetical protein